MKFNPSSFGGTTQQFQMWLGTALAGLVIIAGLALVLACHRKEHYA